MKSFISVNLVNLNFKMFKMKKNALMLIAVKLFFILLMAFLFSSCGTQGYGCKGRASWDQVVRKANRLY